MKQAAALLHGDRGRIRGIDASGFFRAGTSLGDGTLALGLIRSDQLVRFLVALALLASVVAVANVTREREVRCEPLARGAKREGGGKIQREQHHHRANRGRARKVDDPHQAVGDETAFNAFNRNGMAPQDVSGQ